MGRRAAKPSAAQVGFSGLGLDADSRPVAAPRSPATPPGGTSGRPDPKRASEGILAPRRAMGAADPSKAPDSGTVCPWVPMTEDERSEVGRLFGGVVVDGRMRFELRDGRLQLVYRVRLEHGTAEGEAASVDVDAA